MVQEIVVTIKTTKEKGKKKLTAILFIIPDSFLLTIVFFTVNIPKWYEPRNPTSVDFFTKNLFLGSIKIYCF